MATPPKTWPHNVKKARDDTEHLARMIEQLGEDAIKTLRSNPLESELSIVYIMRYAAHIRRLMEAARNGHVPED